MENQERERRVMRFREVRGTVSLSRSTVWRKVRDGSFPRPIRIGKSAVGWIASEVQDWIAEQAAARE